MKNRTPPSKEEISDISLRLEKIRILINYFEVSNYSNRVVIALKISNYLIQFSKCNLRNLLLLHDEQIFRDLITLYRFLTIRYSYVESKRFTPFNNLMLKKEICISLLRSRACNRKEELLEHVKKVNSYMRFLQKSKHFSRQLHK